MALNLVRNSRVFFTTNVNATTGVINQGGSNATSTFTASNTYEIQVLDGFTFSQNVNSETVTLSEASETPVRGQRAFNTSLAPVDFSFSTYIRPKDSTTKITCEEDVLWNALLSSAAIGTPTSLTSVTGVTASSAGVVTIAGTAITGTLPTVGDLIVLSGIATTTPAASVKYVNGLGRVVTSTASGITVQLIQHDGVAVTASTLVTSGTVKYSKAYAWQEANADFSLATTAFSEKNQLQKFGMLFLVDNVLYAVDNAALNQVTIDFGLDQIATAQWTGQATALRQLSTSITAGSSSFTGGAAADVGTGTTAFRAKITDAQFITNKLSTIALEAKFTGGGVVSGTDYVIPITGGSFTINNNITYITPANLSVVNQPVTYYTGTRAISGNLTAYLRTGTSNESGDLLADMLLAASSTIEPKFALAISIGGAANTVHVDLDMPTVVLAIPTIDVQQVVSTNIAFTAQGSTDTGAFDITSPNDLTVRYYA